MARPRRLDLDRFGREVTSGVARVDRIPRLDQEDMRLLVGLRALLDAAGDDEHLGLVEFDVAIAELNCQAPLRTRKKSSVSSCFCRTNSPSTLTTITV
jgi:hypothetical protein